MSENSDVIRNNAIALADRLITEVNISEVDKITTVAAIGFMISSMAVDCQGDEGEEAAKLINSLTTFIFKVGLPTIKLGQFKPIHKENPMWDDKSEKE